MDFRKIVLLIPFFLSVNFVSGQVDTSEYNWVGLDTITPQSLTLADTSLTENHIVSELSLDFSLYEISDSGYVDLGMFGSFTISFNIKDSASFEIVQVNVCHVSENAVAPVESVTYTLSDLHNSGNIIGNYVSIDFQGCDLSISHIISVLVISPIGQEYRVINRIYNP